MSRGTELYRGVFWGVEILIGGTIMIGGAMPISDCVAKDLEEHRKIFGSLKQDPNAKSKNLDSDEMLSKAIQEEKSRESRSQLFQSQSKAQIQALLDILLPHQNKRLVSLCLWNVRDYRFADLLTQPFVQTKLKLMPKQVDSIQPVATKLQKEFEDELEMLKQKYRKRLMDKVFATEQQEVFDQALGENIGSKSDLGFGFWLKQQPSPSTQQNFLNFNLSNRCV